jgi:hypothetical protein
VDNSFDPGQLAERGLPYLLLGTLLLGWHKVWTFVWSADQRHDDVVAQYEKRLADHVATIAYLRDVVENQHQSVLQAMQVLLTQQAAPTVRVSLPALPNIPEFTPAKVVPDNVH